MQVSSPIKILSIHWGFSVGGVAKYAMLIDNVGKYRSVTIKSLCCISYRKHVDNVTLKLLEDKVIIERKNVFDFSWFCKSKEIIKQYKPDFILSHGFNGHFIALVIAGKIPKICSYHGEYHATTPLRIVLGVFYNWFTEFYIQNCVVGTIAVAEYCKRFLITKKVNKNKITVIHNGIEDTVVDTVARDNLRNEWNISKNEVLLGVASRLDPVKGVEFLLGAFLKLAPKYSHIKLVIIGTGTLDHKLLAFVNNNRLQGRVIFTGFRSDIGGCLQAMDFFVLPSLAEYHSIGLLEAMRAAKTIVATDVGGNTESVRHEKEGLIVSPSDVDAIYQSVCRLMEDKELSQRLAVSARQRFLDHFTLEKTVSRTAKWFNDCMKREAN